VRRAALLLVLAVCLFSLWLGLQLLGARAGLGVLSGTRSGGFAMRLLALFYVAAWLAMVIAAPVLLLAAALQAGLAARR
jgi:hypothetical protein